MEKVVYTWGIPGEIKQIKVVKSSSGPEERVVNTSYRQRTQTLLEEMLERARGR
jgi:hypothetical protein